MSNSHMQDSNSHEEDSHIDTNNDNDSSKLSSSTRLQFVPFSSALESSFWVRYSQLKLETWRLSQEPVPVWARLGDEGRVEAPSLEHNDTDTDNSHNHHHHVNERVSLPGVLRGFNTLDDFLQVDKNQLLADAWHESQQREKANSGNDRPQVRFVWLVYADLKAHQVVYWCGFAAPQVPLLAHTTQSLSFSSPLALLQAVTRMRYQLMESDSVNTHEKESFPLYFVWWPQQNKCQALCKTVLAEMGNCSEEEALVCFYDFSTSDAPSWPLRHLVAWLSQQASWGGRANVSILSYRPGRVRRLTPGANPPVTYDDDVAHDTSRILVLDEIPSPHVYQEARIVGWELNARGKPGPRRVNLKPLLDPHHLAVQAADLNLKLMKWRMIPNLQVEKLQALRVLILGAGTLGCNVARTLLGWGVRHLTLVDNGHVSYSNPCRQPLFTLQDCQGRGAFKAVAAAEALRLVAADVHAEGVALSIPMPGHPQDKDELTQTVAELDRLVQAHDVVYLLTDTRESRWWPTVAAAAHGKLLMNAALGLDSWLVMRHGLVGNNDSPASELSSSSSSCLGCYFCNDVVAPENSTKNRTLDQQCTVTRPGLAPIASSMAVELMVAVLHHKDGAGAPAPRTTLSSFSPTLGQHQEDGSTALGLVPHQIRGSLVSYTMMTPTVPAFQHCTGCAPAVIDAYRQDPVNLVYQTCQSVQGQGYLEDLVGLTEFRDRATSALDEMCLEDGDVEEGWGD